MRRDKKEVRSGQEAGFSAEPTRIDMQSSTRSSDETARQTSIGRRIVGVLASGLGRRSSSHYSPTGSPNSPSLLARRQFAFPMLAALAVAALGLSLLFLYNSAFAQQAAGTYYYNEKETDPVVTLTADDPEDVTPIYWDILMTDVVADLPGGETGADADDIDGDDIVDGSLFTVEDGVLSFRSSPDYEMPMGGAGDNSNTYKVVVQASDGGVTTWVQYFKVTVTVLDVEEPGKVTWTVDPDGAANTDEDDEQNLLQFQAGAQLTATVSDPDGPEPLTNVTWEWYRSRSKTSMGTLIDGATTATYDVSDDANNDDVGMYLWAVATYTDERGDNKTAKFVSPHLVQAAVTNNSLPEFAPTEVAREVKEGAKGMNVGAPVTATDADGDELNYTLGAVSAYFEIDQETGQITNKVALNYEEPGDGWGTTIIDEITYTTIDVTVKATDSAGGNTGEAGEANLDATVTITLLDVNEKPEFGGDDANTDITENLNGMAADKAEEGVGDDAVWTAEVSTYTVTDPEGVAIGVGKWSLSGDDAASFKLTGSDDNTRTLEFSEKADFEMPGDLNGDNIYEVTVVASDGTNEATRAVTVKITDSDEAGEIMLSTANPVAGTPVMATLEDSDGDVINVAWTWYTLAEADAEVTAETSMKLAEKSDTYTPVAGDIGRHLVATATYMDRTEDEDNNVDNNEYVDANNDGVVTVRFANTAQSVVTAKVIDDPANAAPEFVEGERAVRYVEENAVSGETIGAPLSITDDDLPADSHTYTLRVTDAASFDIGAGTGQLMTKAALDYEDKATYTVVVTVRDGSGESNDDDSITVTIMVKDLDEKPGVGGEGSVNYNEKETDPVVTLTADDPEDVTPIYWDILMTDVVADLPGGETGADADDIDGDDIVDGSLFTVEDGVLSFRSSPDYEMPMGGAGDNSNTYKVVVQASDGGVTTWVQYFKVTVIVLDVEEPGKVTWTVDPDGDANTAEAAGQNLLEFQVGAKLTATVSDPDGLAVTPNTMWEWYRSRSKASMGTTPIAGTAADGTYTVSDDANNNDVGMYLWAVATYTDGRGEGKTAKFVSTHPVKAPKAEGNSLPEFAPAQHTRRVQEGAKGMNVGAPVTATDADGDELNYTLGASDYFEIDQETGQITNKVALNYEEPGADWGNTIIDGITYTTIDVTVKATDSAGGNTEAGEANLDATVTITLLDVNEKPEFGGDDGNTDITENLNGMAADKAEEGVGDDAVWTAEVSTYTVTDPEGVAIGVGKWSLSGDDAASFKLTGSDDNTRTLEFREKADFEMPGDKNKDNIYEVTVVASDGTNEATRAVTVKITDSDEAGEIMLSTANPVAGTPVMATLEDSDGDVINVAWTWYTLAEADAEVTAETSMKLAEKSDTYTPVAGDIGRHLVATATYMDRTEDEDNNVDNNEYVDTNNDGVVTVRFANTAQSVATAKVIDDPANAAPEFVEGERAVRYVEENAVSGETIGAPLMIEDDDNTSHTYTLSGADAGSFDIGAGTGQLMTKAALDYEDKATYTVVVTVDDGSKASNATDSIMVTIEVKDLDEKPVLMASAGGLDITGPRSVTLEEETTTATGATYAAEGATLTLSGADAGDFRWSSNGALTFSRTPDYETPMDADGDNDYMVTVVATAADGMTADRDVTVTVINVEEPGEVRLSATRPQIGTAITASLTDEDGVVRIIRWEWARSGSMDGPYSNIPGATSDVYTPVAGRR